MTLSTCGPHTLVSTHWLYIMTQKKKTYEFNASHSNTRNERRNTGEKSLEYNQNVQFFINSCVDELTLGQSFDYDERSSALHDKSASITRKSAYTKEIFL